MVTKPSYADKPVGQVGGPARPYGWMTAGDRRDRSFANGHAIRRPRGTEGIDSS